MHPKLPPFGMHCKDDKKTVTVVIQGFNTDEKHNRCARQLLPTGSQLCNEVNPEEMNGDFAEGPRGVGDVENSAPMGHGTHTFPQKYPLPNYLSRGENV